MFNGFVSLQLFKCLKARNACNAFVVKRSVHSKSEIVFNHYCHIFTFSLSVNTAVLHHTDA